MSNTEEKQPEATEETKEEAAEEAKEEAEEKAAEEEPKQDEDENDEEEEAPKKSNKKKEKKTNPKRKQKEDDTPGFERVEDHEFQKGEEVYMIDPNGFDLWEGVVEGVDGDKISIHYPEFPEDDETVEGTERVLVKTDVNKEIYNKQEEVRKLKMEEEEEENEEKPKSNKKKSKKDDDDDE